MTMRTTKKYSNNDFDYSTLDAETLHFVKEKTGEIHTLMRRTAQDIINIGQKLIEIKKRLGHGQYRKWIKAEFNWGKSTANSFENVARRFANVQNLDIFAPSALYELAAPSTPESAREEAISLAQAGKRIGYKFAKEIKKRHILESANNSSSPKSLLSPESAEGFLQNKNSHGDKKNESFSVLLPIKLESPEQQSQKYSIKQNTIDVFAQEVSSKTNSLIVTAESWWQLGKNHLMYCGQPHSPKLQAQLPKRLALAISFPPTANWNLGNLKSKVNSSLILFSEYDDVDLNSLREIVRNALELYTSDQETVIFSFIPDPALLLLAEQLMCCCLIAEPDTKRCQDVIQAWAQTGGKIKMLKALMDWGKLN